MGEGLRLPEGPTLREVAAMLEQSGLAAEIFDPTWRIAFISTEQMKIAGLDPGTREKYYGMSPVKRDLDHADDWGTDPDSARSWWRQVVPTMRHDLATDAAAFDEVFGPVADRAREVEPVSPAAAITVALELSRDLRYRETWLGQTRFVYIRLHDPAGTFAGMLALSVPEMPQGLVMRLARGDPSMFERMDSLREPERRAAGILFADLEASGVLSRRLSSRAYFELIRSLTDLIDGEVASRHGILGKHAGDGASALFLAGPEIGGESGAARSGIEAARAIRDGARALGGDDGDDVSIKVGVHWGSTLTVGQVSSGGRLEVTALGDEMNEGARIESVAGGGSVLASKALIERLTQADAESLSIDPDRLSYTTVAALADGEKALRDAGAIAVVEV